MQHIYTDLGISVVQHQSVSSVEMASSVVVGVDHTNNDWFKPCSRKGHIHRLVTIRKTVVHACYHHHLRRIPVRGSERQLRSRHHHLRQVRRRHRNNHIASRFRAQSKRERVRRTRLRHHRRTLRLHQRPEPDGTSRQHVLNLFFLNRFDDRRFRTAVTV